MLGMRELLWECVDDSLSALGEPTKQSLLWHMSKSGMSASPDDFDIQRFYAVLTEMIGGGADVLLDLVAKKMTEKLGLDNNFSKDFLGMDRVLKILKVAGKVKG